MLVTAPWEHGGNTVGIIFFIVENAPTYEIDCHLTAKSSQMARKFYPKAPKCFPMNPLKESWWVVVKGVRCKSMVLCEGCCAGVYAVYARGVRENLRSCCAP